MTAVSPGWAGPATATDRADPCHSAGALPARVGEAHDGDVDEREQLVAELRDQGITDETVLLALRTVPRDAFVQPRYRGAAWENHPLPIGHDQTISQPFIVALMTQVLELSPGDTVLDVGTGCGYQAAILAELGCQVFGIEVLPTLADQASNTLATLGYAVDVVAGDGRNGRPEHAPYDGIVVAAASRDIPSALLEQLRPPAPGARGGRLVIPLTQSDGQVLVLVERVADGYRRRDLERVRFVPLIGT